MNDRQPSQSPAVGLPTVETPPRATRQGAPCAGGPQTTPGEGGHPLQRTAPPPNDVTAALSAALQTALEGLPAAPAPERPSAFAAAVEEMLAGCQPPVAGSRVTVALSGGADSVALCHFLATHATALGITVAAAHLNHGLRGAESDADEAFVRAFCARLGLQLACQKLPPGAPTDEAALREKRYAFLWQAAGKGFLATGHTLTDSCETLLLCLARGTGLAGARGIPAQRGRLIRPLLALTRQDTEDYCRAQGLDYVTDSSNLTDAYARNRLRHHALPALVAVNPRAQQAMGAFMRQAGEIYDLLQQQATRLLADAWLPDAAPAFDQAPAPGNADTSADAPAFLKGPWAAAVLAAAPPVLLRQALALLLAPYGRPSAARLGLAVAVMQGGGAVDWCAGVRLRCRAGRVFLQLAPPAVGPVAPPTPFLAPPADCPPPAAGQGPPGLADAAGRFGASDRFGMAAPSQGIALHGPGMYDCGGGLWVQIRPWDPSAAELGAPTPHPTPLQTGMEKENGAKPWKIHKKDLNNRLDCAKIAAVCSIPPGDPALGPCAGQLVLRFRAPHDRFAPAWGNGSKSLKKWFNEIACPPQQRGRLPLIAVGSRVLWLAGSGAAKGFAAQPGASLVWEVLWGTADQTAVS